MGAAGPGWAGLSSRDNATLGVRAAAHDPVAIVDRDREVVMMVDERRVEFRTCPLCEATCGLQIDVEGLEITRIRGDRDDVFSHGFICPKGSTLKQLHVDPDRLRQPLVRRDGVLVEVGWDEAWVEVDRLLGPYLAGDRNAIGVYLGNPNVHNLGHAIFLRPLLKALGTRSQFSASSVDQMPKHVSCGYLFGSPLAIPVPDLDRTGYLLMLGANPLASNGSLCTAPDFPGRLTAIRERGGRVVVVDPRRSETAEVADEHLAIRPGTDAAWLAALVTTVFEDGRCRPGPVEPWLSGIAEVRSALAGFTAESVAATTGIEPTTTRRIARELADAPSAAVYGRIGTHTAEFGTLAAWLVDVLTTVIGGLDSPGGIMFPLAAVSQPVGSDSTAGRGFTTGRWSSRVRDLPEVIGELPVATLPDEILTPGEGQIRVLVTVAGNPARSCPDSNRMEDALRALDVLVCLDPYLNETARLADIVLPPVSTLEKSHYDIAFTGLAVRNVANWSPAVFAATGPSDSEILARLALVASGLGARADPAIVDQLVIDTLLGAAVRNEHGPVFERDPAELAALVTGDDPADRALDVMLRCGPYGDGFGARPGGLSLATLVDTPHGVDLGPLQSRLPGLLSTPSGMVELAHPALLADLPRLAERLGRPVPGLVLVGRRHVRSNNSWMHNIEVLVKGRERCTLQIHPDDAARSGVVDGGRARVTSRVGEVVAAVEVSDVCRPGVVCLPHGWGHDSPGARMTVAAGRPGVNSNALTDGDAIDVPSGNAVLNGIPVEVHPA